MKDQIIEVRKITGSNKREKQYTVTVTFIELSEEQVKIKRAILEGIIKKNSSNEH